MGILGRSIRSSETFPRMPGGFAMVRICLASILTFGKILVELQYNAGRLYNYSAGILIADYAESMGRK